MDFGKRVASAYKFVLDDLKAPNKRLIRALTLLALEDIVYCKNIVDVICQQVFKVDTKSKLFVIYLLDSIVKTVDGSIYRLMFGQIIPHLFLHVYKTATNEVRNSLYEVRQTWNGLFAAEVLEELDGKVRRVDSNWLYTLNEVKSQIELIRKEIGFLEQRLEKVDESKKRFRTEVTVGEISSKKRDVSRSGRKSSFDCDSEINLLSSVLLTPSPEREECELDTSTFWLTMSNLESRKSNSPISQGQSFVEFPFLNDSCLENNAVEMSSLEVSVDMQNTNTEVSVEQTFEETAVENELEVIESNVPFINLDNYKESLCMIPNAIIETETIPLEFDENECEEPTNDSLVQPTNSTEPYRTSPPLMLSIDGNIELEPLKPSQKASKQIKINLTNSKVVEAVESPKIPDIRSEPEQAMQKKPTEWKTPLITFEVKESMKKATFYEQPICRKGWEQSGMCSIM